LHILRQAFYQARDKVSEQVFDPINRHRMALVEEYLSIPRWRGFVIGRTARRPA